MRYKILFMVFSIGILSSSGCLAGNSKHFIPTDESMEQKIESLVKRMTLEEKIGQMTQLTLDVLGEGNSIYESHLPFFLMKRCWTQ